MSKIGLNVAADGRHDVRMLHALGVTFIRVVPRFEYDIAAYLDTCRQASIDVLLTFARESFMRPEDSATRRNDLQQWKQMYGQYATWVQAGNEPDGAGGSSWAMPQNEFVALGHDVRTIFSDVPVISGGLASGHAEWLDGADLSWCDALAIHPYLKDAPNPGDIEDLPDVDAFIATYARFRKPIVITEWGWWGDDRSVLNEQARARAVAEVADMTQWAAQTDDVLGFAYFCADDAMVVPFGLRDASGNDKPKAIPFTKYAMQAQNTTAFEQLASSNAAPTGDALVTYAREAATRNGVDPDRFVRQIRQESQFNPQAYNAGSDASGIAQIVPRFHPGVDVWDPHASLDYAAKYDASLAASFGGDWAKAFAAYNWGPGNVKNWDGKRAALPAETRAYLDVILGPNWESGSQAVDSNPTYNRNEPVHPQEHDYDCSQDSTEWAMWSWGRRPADSWMEQAMIDQGVMSKEQGLLDGSGAGLAKFVKDNYSEFGYDANNTPSVTFDDLAAEFAAPNNPYPGVIGGHHWGSAGHWSGLRDYDASHDVLRLANPADGYMGVSQTMTRAQFNALGPFSLVRIMHPDASVDEPAHDDAECKATASAVATDLSALAAELNALATRLRNPTP